MICIREENGTEVERGKKETESEKDEERYKNIYTYLMSYTKFYITFEIYSLRTVELTDNSTHAYFELQIRGVLRIVPTP